MKLFASKVGKSLPSLELSRSLRRELPIWNNDPAVATRRVRRKKHRHGKILKCNDALPSVGLSQSFGITEKSVSHLRLTLFLTYSSGCPGVLPQGFQTCNSARLNFDLLPLLPEDLSCFVQSPSGGGVGTVNDLCNFVTAHFVDITEQDHSFVLFRHGVENTVDFLT